MAHTVILAAGAGTRMGADLPKCLLPVSGDQGTLDLILQWRAPEATVVYGDPRIAAHVRRVWPGVRVRHNPHRETGMLGSLVAGTADLNPRPLMVLLGDTLYQPAFRQRVEGWSATTVAVQPVIHGRVREIPVDVADGRVLGIGGHCPARFEMASAVSWAAHDWDVFRAATAATRQADVLDQAITAGRRVDALGVPAGSVFDIDTPDDLARARQLLATVRLP